MQAYWGWGSIYLIDWCHTSPYPTHKLSHELWGRGGGYACLLCAACIQSICMHVLCIRRPRKFEKVKWHILNSIFKRGIGSVSPYDVTMVAEVCRKIGTVVWELGIGLSSSHALIFRYKCGIYGMYIMSYICSLYM